MNKCHTPITWHNNTTPAINETNLNYEDGCIDTIDDRVVAMDTSKANQSDLLTAMADWNVDNATGDVTITLKSGQTITRHTNLGKIAINVRVIHDPTDPHYQEMEITMPDGTKDYVDFSAFVTQFEFVDSSEIHASVNSDGEVSFSLINGSITGAKLQPNYLADVTAQANIASAAASSANTDQLKSEGFANGTQGGVPVSSGSPYYENNAKYWEEQAKAIASSTLSGLSDVSITNPQDGQALVYDAGNSEWVNGKSGILPHVIVISDAGSTVTLTKGTKVVTASETSTGHFEADVDEYGTWTIDSILAGDDAQVSLVVDNVKIYTVDDSHFHADISVTYPSIATQCALSASGQTTQYATESPYTFTVHEAGTYTLSVTCRGATRTETYSVTATGQTFSKDFTVVGATVTPINDVATWLDCAYLWDKNYALLADVIGDSEALLALISDNNAVDYMVRSISFRTLICADALAMLYIGQYNYCANKLLERARNLLVYPYVNTTMTDRGVTFTDNYDGSVTVQWSGTSGESVTFMMSHSSHNGPTFLGPGTYIISGRPGTSGTAPTYRFYLYWVDNQGTHSEYVLDESYQFTIDSTEPVLVTVNINVPVGAVYPGSPITFRPMIRLATDTDDTWEPYLPWLKPICESELFELVLNEKVPLMTSNTTPSGECFASSIQGSGNEAYRAFDGYNETKWVSAVGSYQNSYVGYDFGDNKLIYMSKITHQYTGQSPKNFKLQAFDGTDWIDATEELNPFEGGSIGVYGSVKVPFTKNIGPYSKYRLFASTIVNTSEQILSIAGLQFYGRTDVTPPASRTLKTFATASNEEILEMVCKADRGEIDLYDDAGWRGEQEHSVSIDPIPASGSYNGVRWSVGESQPAQTVTFGLMHKGLYKFSNSVTVLDKQGQARDTCSFVVGMKDCLSEEGYMNSTLTNTGSWNDCARRAWCNYAFRQALPIAFRAAFKLCKVVTALEYNSSSTKTSDDYFAFAAEKEVFGTSTNSKSEEASALTQFTWYTTASNRIKQRNGDNNYWWERSPRNGQNAHFCGVLATGTAAYGNASGTGGLSPFGCM